MQYKIVKVYAPEAHQEPIIATLMGIGFESFEEQEDAVLGYIPADALDQQLLTNSLEELARVNESAPYLYNIQDLEDKNWNEEWESNFEPIIVEDQILVKASFHTVSKSYPFEILINPKMSFGTGHHETTYLMLKQLLSHNLNELTLLDVGSGTGILAIFAKMAGASEVMATDIDDWCIKNSKENFSLNNCSDIAVKQGIIDQLGIDNTYDIVLANINKNVLIDEIPHYQKLMKPGAYLLLSGFYDSDQEDIEQCCQSYGLSITLSDYKNHWACLTFKKS